MRKTYEDISTRRLHCKNGANFIQCFQISAANPQDISRHHLSHFNQTQFKKKNINSDTFANQSTQSSSSTTGQIPSQNKENSDPTINDRFSAASAQPTKI
jgi:hypothetical protein